MVLTGVYLLESRECPLEAAPTYFRANFEQSQTQTTVPLHLQAQPDTQSSVLHAKNNDYAPQTCIFESMSTQVDGKGALGALKDMSLCGIMLNLVRHRRCGCFVCGFYLLGYGLS